MAEIDRNPHHPSLAAAAVAAATLVLTTLLGPLAAPCMAQAEAPAAEPEAPSGRFADVVEVRVINVEVFVTDRQGNPIAGLDADDFVLRVDGELFPISNFYSELGGLATERRTAAPTADTSFRPLEEVEARASQQAHLVILVDHPRIRPANRKRAFKALREALDGVDQDVLVAIAGLESSLVFYSDFLYDRQALHRILDDISKVSGLVDVGAIERRQILNELNRGISGGILARRNVGLPEDPISIDQPTEILNRIQAYAAEQYAFSRRSFRLIEHMVSTMVGLPGRKALLYVGEGIPTRPGEELFVEWRNRHGQGSGPDASIGIRRIDFNTDYEREVGRYDLTDAMRRVAKAANRSGVTLYGVDAEGNHGGEIRSALTEQGATSEAVSVVDANYRAPLEYATRETGGRLLRSSGNLAEQLTEISRDLGTFYSVGFNPPAGWRPGDQHDIEVDVRGEGLVVRHRETVALPQANEREAGATLAALLYQAVNNPLGLRSQSGERIPRDDGSAAMPVLLEIPVKNLELLPQGGKHAASLTIYVSTKDKDGGTRAVQKIPFHLEIPDEHVEQAREDMARYTIPLVVRPGDQQAAIGVRDDVSGTFSAVRLDIAAR